MKFIKTIFIILCFMFGINSVCIAGRIVLQDGTGKEVGTEANPIYVSGGSGGSSQWDDNYGIKTIDQNGLLVATTNMSLANGLLTYNGNQYAVYWNGDRELTLAVRELPSGEWTIESFSAITLTTEQSADAHNSLSLGVDTNGYLHIVGGTHDTAITYWVTDNPEDISAVSVGTLIGTNEENATYGVFFNDNNDELFMMFRDGESGDGDSYLYKYNTSTAAWGYATGTTQGLLIDGKTSSVNAYPSFPYVDENNVAHFWGGWRETYDATTLKNLFYFRYNLTTGAATKSDGSAQTIPIAESNDEVLDAITTGSGFVDCQSHHCITGSGNNIYIIYQKADANDFSQVWFISFNGTSWSTPKALTQSLAEKRAALGEQILIIGGLFFNDNKLYAYYQNRAQGAGILVLESDDYGDTWINYSILEVFPNARFNIDKKRLISDGVLNILMQYVPSVSVYGSKRSQDIFEWSPQSNIKFPIKTYQGLYSDGDIVISPYSGKLLLTTPTGAVRLGTPPKTGGLTGGTFSVIGDVTSGNAGITSLNTASSSSAGGGGLFVAHDDSSPMASGDRLGSIGFGGYSGSYVRPGALIRSFATDLFTDTNTPGNLIFYTTPSGSINPSERLTILSTGFVGIGTTAPTSALDVTGTATMTGFKLTTSPTNGYVLTSDANGVGSWAASAGGSSDKISEGNTEAEVVDTGTDGHFKVTTEGVERLRVLANGNVGIGTSAPDVTLNVNGIVRMHRSSMSNYIEIFGDASGNYIVADDLSTNQKDLRLQTKTNKNILLEPHGNGRVGIATSNPGAKTHIVATTEQLRLGYDTSNYVTITVGTTGGMTLNAVGSGSSFVFSDPVIVTPTAAQTIAAGNTITANACGSIKEITAEGAVTTDTTNTFTAPAAGNDGCCMDVVNIGAENITLDNNANFVSAGAADVVLGAGDTLRVCSTGASGKWYQIGATGNN